MSNALPPLPVKTPMLDAKGMLTPAWYAFFRELYVRVGQATGSSLTTVASQITALQADFTSSQTGIAALGQGRQL